MLRNSPIEFLKALTIHNDREWFNENKSWYLEAKSDVEAVAGQILTNIQKFDPRLMGTDLNKCIFRIYRDVRFSKDKSPYKTHFGIYFAPGGKNSTAPGYYLHIEPGECMIGGGVWMPSPQELFALRQEIYYNWEEFKGITQQPAFKANFPMLDDTFKNVKAPKGFEPDFEGIDILKNKCFFYGHRLSDEELSAPDFSRKVDEMLQILLPFNQFLLRALEN